MNKSSFDTSGLTFDRFKLSVRTTNCLRVQMLVTIRDLNSKSAAEVLSWPNAGRKTLNELRALLGRLGLKLVGDSAPIGAIDLALLEDLENVGLDEKLEQPVEEPNKILYLNSSETDTQRKLVLPLSRLTISVRSQTLIKTAKLSFLGDLAQLKFANIVSYPNAGRKTANELAGILEEFGFSLGTVIPDWTAVRAAALNQQFHEALANDTRIRDKKLLKAIAPEPHCLEDELTRIAKALDNERNAQLLIKLWGWNGDPPRTLESVGQELQLTRERVRQIEARAIKRLARYDFETPHVKAAVTILRRAAPTSDVALAKKIREEGISKGQFSPWSVQTAAEIFHIRWPFEVVNSNRTKLLVLSSEVEMLQRALSILRRKTAELGCLNTIALASELQIPEPRIAGVLRFLEHATQVSWLDDERQWLYAPDTARNRLMNLCSKVLAVCDSVYLSDLRHAVTKSRRLPMCPPKKTLGAFVEQRGLGSIEGTIVRPIAGMNTPPPSGSAEGIMLAVLNYHGPIMDGDEFAEKCIAAGMNPITFYIYRMVSPVVSALGKNVYCKVGTEVAPGTVEGMVAHRRSTPLVADHGWTPDGKLWFATEMSRQVITAGSFRLAQFISDLVQGDWQVKLPDNTLMGGAVCRGRFIWSFRKQLALLGAELSDIAAFEFDLRARTVVVRVGGSDLIEAMGEGTGSVEEELALPP